TIANHILGFGQMSLAKYLFIAAKEDSVQLSVDDIQAFMTHMLERVDWKRDLHFYTNATIDTLDYSGTGLNAGSKLVIAAVGNPRRDLSGEIPPDFSLPPQFSNPRVVFPGVICIQATGYVDGATAEREMGDLSNKLSP
ncbi:MAG: UbiD family decarboxylase, partial [Flavobacteriales bacterium]|nr:UbiD family decarboxylase [Flavobacteriales bacterium]